MSDGTKNVNTSLNLSNLNAKTKALRAEATAALRDKDLFIFDVTELGENKRLQSVVRTFVKDFDEARLVVVKVGDINNFAVETEYAQENKTDDNTTINNVPGAQARKQLTRAEQGALAVAQLDRRRYGVVVLRNYPNASDVSFYACRIVKFSIMLQNFYVNMMQQLHYSNTTNFKLPLAFNDVHLLATLKNTPVVADHDRLLVQRWLNIDERRISEMRHQLGSIDARSKRNCLDETLLSGSDRTRSSNQILNASTSVRSCDDSNSCSDDNDEYDSGSDTEYDHAVGVNKITRHSNVGDDDDDNADTMCEDRASVLPSSSSRRHNSTSTTTSRRRDDEFASDDESNERLLRRIRMRVMTNRRRSNANFNPFVDRLLEDSSVKLLVQRCGRLAAVYTTLFHYESFGQFGRDLSHIDAFTLYNAVAVLHLHSISFADVNGTEQDFINVAEKLFLRARLSIWFCVSDMLSKLGWSVFINNDLPFEKKLLHVLRMLMRASLYSPTTYIATNEAFRKHDIANFIASTQLMGTWRQRTQSVATVVAEKIEPENAANRRVYLQHFLSESFLVSEYERVFCQVFEQGPANNCIDVVLRFPIDSVPAVTPLNLLSTVREFCPSACDGTDFVVLFTPHSFVDTKEHTRYRNLYKNTHKRTSTALVVPQNSYEMQQTSDKQFVVKCSKKRGRNDANKYIVEWPNRASKREIRTTIGHDCIILAMKAQVAKQIQRSHACTILTNRVSNARTLRSSRNVDKSYPLASPLVAQTIADPASSTTQLCMALNSLSALFGGSAVEWSPESNRTTRYAREVASLVCRIADIFIHESAFEMILMTMVPMSLQVESGKEHRANLKLDSPLSTLYSVLQLVLNGNAIPIASPSERDFEKLRDLCYDGADGKWTKHFALRAESSRIVREEREAAIRREEERKLTRRFEGARAKSRKQSVDEANSMPSTAETAELFKKFYGSLDNSSNISSNHSNDSWQSIGVQCQQYKTDCSCGGAELQECDNLLKNGMPLCCVCTICNTQVDYSFDSSATSSSTDAEDAKNCTLARKRKNWQTGKNAFVFACKWCKQRIAWRGAQRVDGFSRPNAGYSTTQPVYATIFDPRENSDCTFTSMMLHLVERMEADLARLDAAGQQLSESAVVTGFFNSVFCLRFNLQEMPSRVSIPRNFYRRREDEKTYDVYKKQLQNYVESRVHASGIQVQKELFANQLSSLTNLSSVMSKTLNITEHGQQLPHVPSKEVLTPGMHSLAMAMANVELVILASFDTVITEVCKFETIMHMALNAENRSEKATKRMVAQTSTFFDLLCPFRSALDVDNYLSGLQVESATFFPLCQSSIAESTAIGVRSASIMGNTRFRFAERFKFGFLENGIERYATSAMPLMLEVALLNFYKETPMASIHYIQRLLDMPGQAPLLGTRATDRRTVKTSNNDDDDDNSDEELFSSALLAEKQNVVSRITTQSQPMACDVANTTSAPKSLADELDDNTKDLFSFFLDNFDEKKYAAMNAASLEHAAKYGF